MCTFNMRSGWRKIIHARFDLRDFIKHATSMVDFVDDCEMINGSSETWKFTEKKNIAISLWIQNKNAINRQQTETRRADSGNIFKIVKQFFLLFVHVR